MQPPPNYPTKKRGGSLGKMNGRLGKMKGRKLKVSSSKVTNNKLELKKGTPKKTEKKMKAGKDINKPKRAPSAFFIFMEGFRMEFKEQNPKNKSIADIGKAGGKRWKFMFDAEKAPFVKKAEKLKAEYEKIVAYNKGKKSTLLAKGKDLKQPLESAASTSDESQKKEKHAKPKIGKEIVMFKNIKTLGQKYNIVLHMLSIWTAKPYDANS